MTVEGFIYSKQGIPLYGASICTVVIATKQRGEVVKLSDNSYKAWADATPEQIAVAFDAPGFKEQIIPLTLLAQSPDVYLDRSVSVIPIALAAGLLLMTTKKKKTKSLGAVAAENKKLTTSDIMPFILIIAAIMGFDIIQKILDKLGLGSDKKRQDEMQDPNSPWKPTYYKNYTVYTYAISTAQAQAFSKQIHDAFTVFQDDYNKIFAVFSQMRTKCNVSFLAYVFQNQYGEDLLSFLGDGGGVLPWDGLSTAHLNQLIDLVNNLPTN